MTQIRAHDHEHTRCPHSLSALPPAVGRGLRVSPSRCRSAVGDGCQQGCRERVEHPVDLLFLVVEVPEGDEQLIDVAEPGVGRGLVDPGVQVVFDLGEPVDLGGVDLEELAADAGVLVAAVGAVGPVTVTQGHLAAQEVLVELRPFVLGGVPVFG